MGQSRLLDFDPQSEEVTDDWTFADASTNYMTHGLHPYPARMIPQVARKLIIRYSKDGNTVWDPFCGSGSALVESMLMSRKSVGTDLNPFAIFLSKVKTTPIASAVIRNAGRAIIDKVMALEDSDEEAPIPEMHNIDYWFKEYVQRDLARVLRIVNEKVKIIHRDANMSVQYPLLLKSQFCETQIHELGGVRAAVRVLLDLELERSRQKGK